ncbi:Putative LOC101744750, partial [Caligus rogercresseyi]
SEATVFQAEVFAITQAVEAVLQLGKPSGDVKILSDSQSAIAAILNPLTTSSVVKECKETLLKAKSQKNIQLSYCKGHNDLIGNEFADFLAKSGTTSQNRKCVGISQSFIKKSLYDAFYKAWCRRYFNERTMAHTRGLLGKPNKKIVNLDRQKLRLLVQAYTGHGPFLAPFSKMEKLNCNLQRLQGRAADSRSPHQQMPCTIPRKI